MAKCMNCGTTIDYEPEYCCDGRECGCRGLPIDPPLCDKCWENVMGAPAPMIVSSNEGILSDEKAVLINKAFETAFNEEENDDDEDSE